MDIQKLLKAYRENKAKIRFLQLENEGLNHSLRLDRQQQESDDLDEIEGIQLGAAALSDMPRGNTNKFHSVTETAVLTYRQSRELTNLDIREMIKENESRIYSLNYDVRLVEEVIYPALNPKELFIIQMLYEKEYTYKEISDMYQDKFKIYRSNDALKHDRKDILNRLSELMKISA